HCRYHLPLVRPRPPAGSRRAHLLVDRTDVCDGPLRSSSGSGTPQHNRLALRRGIPRAERPREGPGTLLQPPGETTQIPHRKIVAVMANKAVVGEKVGMTQV